MAAEVIDLTASQPDGLEQPGTSGRQQGAALGLDLAAASPRAAAQHRRRQRPPAEPLIDLTGEDDEENWQPRQTKRHRAEQQHAAAAPPPQRREPWDDGSWDAEWPGAAPVPQPLQQRSQGAHFSPQRQRGYSVEQPEPQQPQQQQKQEQDAEVQQPAQPPQQQQQEEGRRQDVQQEAAGQEEAQAQQRCDICFDDEIAPAFMHTFASCKHSFCLPCLREYISGKIQDRTFPVPCPLPDCKAPISAAECGLVLTPEEAATLGKMEAEAAIGEGARLFCPNPQCSMLLLNDDKQADAPIDCPYCQKQLCANCGVAWHAGMTCQQYQAQPGALRSKEDQALLDLAEQEGMRRCPACGAMVQRTQGCSHMACRCGARFCYGCGKRKEAGSNHYCTCKPAHEQWLNPPPAMAAQLQQNAAAYVEQFRQQQQQARAQAAAARRRAQDQAAAARHRAQEQAAARAALVQAFMRERQQQRRARRGPAVAAGAAAGNQQQAPAAGAAAAAAGAAPGPAAAGAAPGPAAAMRVPPLHAGLPGAAAFPGFPQGVPIGLPPPVAGAFRLPPPPAGAAFPELPPGIGDHLNDMMGDLMGELQRQRQRRNRR